MSDKEVYNIWQTSNPHKKGWQGAQGQFSNYEKYKQGSITSWMKGTNYKKDEGTWSTS
jgi:hypothetical protein